MIKLVIDRQGLRRLKNRLLAKYAPGYVAKVNREYNTWHAQQSARVLGFNHEPIAEALAMAKSYPRFKDKPDGSWSTGAVREAERLRAQARELLDQAQELEDQFLNDAITLI